MPRVTVTQSNFTAGEISPRLYGRTDLAKYLAGAKQIRNGIVLQHGGVRRRDGTVFVQNAGSGKVRLIRYVFNRDQAYCLEFGAGYIRFFVDAGAVLDSGNNTYQITTTYTEDELFDLSFTQAGDVMFIAHRAHPLAMLTRLSHASWTITDVSYVNQPVNEDVWYVPTELTLDNATVGTLRGAWSPIFRYSDYRRDAKGQNVSRKIYSAGGGEAIITGNATGATGTPPSAVKHTIDIIKPFESTTIGALDWWMDGQPQATLTITGSLGAGSAMTLTYGADAGDTAKVITNATETTYSGRRAATLNLATATAYDPIGSIIKITKVISGDVGYYDIVSGTDLAPVILIDSFEDVADFIGANSVVRRTSNTSGNMAVAADVGGLISINGGYVKVNEVKANAYIGEVVKTLNSAVAAVPNSWSLLRPTWTEDSGYPCTVTTYEQRLIAAGTTNNPNTVWFSKIGNFFDFLPGTLDDDAMSVTITGSEQADIVHLLAGKALVAMASNGEYTFVGGVEKPITPTNIQIKNQSVYGSSTVRPQRIGNELFFMQRAGRKLRAFTYKYDSDDYGSPDMSIMSEHLTESGIVDMAYAAEPESVLWLAREDGGFVSVTIERENDVVGWCDHTTDGLVESVCSVPSTDGDTVWLSVNRNGTRRIERMDSDVLLDSAVVGTSVSPSDVWSGLDHLEGETVSVIGDGVILSDTVVSGGQVTISRAASAVTIGLPYTTTIETLMQDISTSTGSLMGNSNRIGEVSIRYLNTYGCKVNGDAITFRRYDTSILDDVPVEFTGIKRIETLGWERGDVTVTITQEDPLPFHIQQVIFKFQGND